MNEKSIILSESEYEHLLEEIHQLQAHLAVLIAMRDDLVYHVCPALQAEYEEKVVSLERELFAANLYMQEKKRILEILQAQLNRQQALSVEQAEQMAREEFKKHEEELKRKAEEARKFRERWEKESQWSAHDKAEKERQKSAGEKKSGENGDSGNPGEKEKDGRKDGKSRGNNEEAGSKENCSGRNGSGDEDMKNGVFGEDGEEPGAGGEKTGGDGGRSKETGGESDGSKDTGGGGEDRKRESPVQRLKSLYRKIVKRLHPDAHPNPTEHERDLLNKATQAYDHGDLDEIERIWDELCGMDAPEENFADTEEGRQKLRELLAKLKDRCRMLEEEIHRIKTDFPYRYKPFLEDEEAVAEVRRVLQEKIDMVREMDRKLAEKIEELKEELARRKPA